ncbi:hypothetical protein HJC23_013440 [Cyclotella cryptica]|uniref:CCHC-type domain-containing protein n=1 Tax=Cyclotella cryptica TaxID=29204 RepID=A0ABD3P1U8_9STRA|eukprot:CCRYP_018493-RA/>CCRYP_018493-RA protein AED:0.29 eAED:0.29 QI:0/-1/0/1/-1/1/1/0/453
MESLSPQQTIQALGKLPPPSPTVYTHPTFLWRLYPEDPVILQSSSTKCDSVNLSVNDYVYVRPKSVREPGILGRVVDINESASAILPKESQPIISNQIHPSARTHNVDRQRNGRVSILQSNGVIKHNVRVSRLVPIFDRTVQQHNPSNPNKTSCTLILLTPDTTNYRQLAVAHVRSDDKVLEIGCSYGGCTALLLRRLIQLRSVDTTCSACTKDSGASSSKISIREDTPASGVIVAFDTGSDMVEQTRQSLQAELKLVSSVHSPQKQSELEKVYSDMATVHKIDAFADPKGAFSLATRNHEIYPTVILIDIGGNRELEGVARMIHWVQGAFSRQPPRAIIIKSKELTQELHSHLQDGIVTHAQDWLIDFLQINNSVNSIPLKSQPPPSYSHPLQAPLVLSPKDNTTPICRFHNYHAEGCKRYNDECSECPLDHDYCHWCKRNGHVARECSGSC